MLTTLSKGLATCSGQLSTPAAWERTLRLGGFWQFKRPTRGSAITAGAGQAFGHDGSIDGYHTQAFHFRESKTTLVSIVNQDGADPNDITLAALQTLFKP